MSVRGTGAVDAGRGAGLADGFASRLAVASVRRTAIGIDAPTPAPHDCSRQEEVPVSRIEKTLTIDAPIDVVYGQWTQFESFPLFMDGVDKVVQLDDRTLDWTATLGGRTKHGTARIVDQTPHVRIAWKSIDGPQNDGAVMFTSADLGRTDVRLVVDADPDGLVEEVGDRLGFLDRQVGGDLGRFRDFVEGRSEPTGSWPGAIHGDDTTFAGHVDRALPTTASLAHADDQSTLDTTGEGAR